jgi:hypothetical protein
MKKPRTKINPGNRKNLDTINAAARDGNLCLMLCHWKDSGKPVDVLCAVNRQENSDSAFVPLATLFDGNPYELLLPPQ